MHLVLLFSQPPTVFTSWAEHGVCVFSKPCQIYFSVLSYAKLILNLAFTTFLWSLLSTELKPYGTCIIIPVSHVWVLMVISDHMYEHVYMKLELLFCLCMILLLSIWNSVCHFIAHWLILLQSVAPCSHHPQQFISSVNCCILVHPFSRYTEPDCSISDLQENCTDELGLLWALAILSAVSHLLIIT